MDFDVDKVTLLGSSFNRNGEYIGWSNFFDYDNIESLKLSETIPYPTGETLKVEVILDKNFEEPSIDDPIAIADYQNKLRAYNEAKQIALNKYNEIKPYIVSLVVGEANGKLSLVIDNDQLPPEEQLNNLRKLIKALKIIEANDFHIYIPEEVNNNPILKRRIDYFKNRIDEHNLYIANHKYLEENAAKNMISSTLIQISIDPSNLIQSQSSVDDMTTPLKNIANKSPRGSKDRRNAPGNSVIYSQVLVTNMTGKDVIAIAASHGMKCFYALTQYYNTVLSKGDANQINRLLFDKKIGNTEAHLLANAWIKDPSRLRNIDNGTVYQVLLSVMDNPHDSALVLSAILSLATDNAKELALDKLNAGVDMVGLYLYGIMIGMDFRDISKILISNTAEVLADMQKGNVFNNESGYSILSSVFNTLESNPPMPNGIARSVKDSNDNTLLHYLKIFSGSPKNARVSDIKSNIINFLNNSSEKDIINRFYTLKETVLEYGNDGNLLFKQNRPAIYKYLDSLETFVRNKIKINKDVRFDGTSPYQDLKTLFYGYSELRRLNKMLSLNQGIKGPLNDKLSFIRSFENFINDRYIELTSNKNEFEAKYRGLFDGFAQFLRSTEDYYKGEYTISLDKFCFDENYRNTIIDFYDKIKHTFNIFDVVWTIPHYQQYLIDSVIDDKGISIASKFRTMKKALDEVLVAYNATSMKEKQNYTKAVTNFIDTILTNSWLKTREPIVTEDSALVLGTREGNIAFKKWMEEVVIPNLKSGNLGAGNRAVLHNKFIDDINPVSIDRTATKQPMSVYILPVNMMTKSASEQNLLEGYKIDFNNLRYRSYYVKSGDTTYKYPITDLFFYYNLINYKNSVNQNSLTSLYESMNRSGEVILLRDYNKFISEFDSRSDITEGVDYTKDDLLRAVAPIVSEFTANKKQLPYFYSYDEYSMSYVLKQRTEEAKNNDEAIKYLSTSEEDLDLVDNIIEDTANESLFENDIYDIDEGNIYDVDEDNLEVEESKSKESKSNYKRVNDVDIQDARFNPDIPLGTLSDLVITKNLASEGNPVRIGTITLTGKMSSGNLLPKEIKYKGKTYNTLDLLNVAKNNYKDEIKSGKMEDLKMEDLYIPTKEVFINGEKKVIIDFGNFQDIIDYIFNNPCK